MNDAKKQPHYCNCSFIKNGGYRILSRLFGAPTSNALPCLPAGRQRRDWAYSDLSEPEWKKPVRIILPVLKLHPCTNKKKSLTISCKGLF